MDDLNRNDRGQNRILAGYDAIDDRIDDLGERRRERPRHARDATAVSSYGTDAAGAR